MLLYHASQLDGLTELSPEKFFDNIVYLATRIEDCCAYLANPIKLFCNKNNISTPTPCWKWAVNDRDKNTNTPILLEWWDGAFEELYKGVSSNYYVVEANKDTICSTDDSNKLKKHYTCIKPVKIKRVIKVPDVYKEMLRLEKAGKIKLYRFKNLTTAQKGIIKNFVDSAYKDNSNVSELMAFCNAKLSFYKD